MESRKELCTYRFNAIIKYKMYDKKWHPALHKAALKMIFVTFQY